MVYGISVLTSIILFEKEINMEIGKMLGKNRSFLMFLLCWSTVNCAFSCSTNPCSYASPTDQRLSIQMNTNELAILGSPPNAPSQQMNVSSIDGTVDLGICSNSSAQVLIVLPEYTQEVVYSVGNWPANSA